MKATTEGQRLKALRKALDATQQLIADLSGVQRVTINRAENGKVKWRSTDLKEGLMAAFSMSYEQLASYMAGAMTLREAIALAEPKIAEARARGTDQKAREEILEEVFRRASADEPILQCTRDAMAEAYADLGHEVSTATMVRETLTLNRSLREHIAHTKRALRSDAVSPKA